MPSRHVVSCWVPPTPWPLSLVSSAGLNPISHIFSMFALSGTIRGDFALAVGRNICHGSDSVENAEKEIQLLVSSVIL